MYSNHNRLQSTDQCLASNDDQRHHRDPVMSDLEERNQRRDWDAVW